MASMRRRQRLREEESVPLAGAKWLLSTASPATARPRTTPGRGARRTPDVVAAEGRVLLLPPVPADWEASARQRRARSACRSRNRSCGRAPARRSAAWPVRGRVCAQVQPPPAEHADVGVDEDCARDAAHQAAGGGPAGGRDGRRARPLRERAARGQRARRRGHERAAAGARRRRGDGRHLGPVGGAAVLGQLLTSRPTRSSSCRAPPPASTSSPSATPSTAPSPSRPRRCGSSARRRRRSPSPCGREGAREVRRPPAAAGGGGDPRADAPRRRPRPRRRAARRERRGVEAIVLDEWVRTSSDSSRVLRSPRRAQGGEGLDLVRCVVGAGGKLRYV